LNYEQVRSVRIYVGKSPEFYRAGCHGRTVLWHLHVEADPTGRVEVKLGEEHASIAYRLDLPIETFRVGIEKLIELDLIRWEPQSVTLGNVTSAQDVTFSLGGAIAIVDFVAAQTAKISRALRARNFRARQRAIKSWSKRRSVTRGDVAAGLGVTKLTVVTAAEAKEQRLITRTQAAYILGVSLATLRRREGKSVFPILTDLGEHVFRESEIREAASKEIHALAPLPQPREQTERAGDPIWRQRAERLAEAIGEASYSTAEMHAIGRRIGLKESVIEHVLASTEWLDLAQKVNGKWSALVPVKGEKP
jgi:hypothetical protein